MVQTTTTTIPHGGGGSSGQSTITIGDNVNTSSASNVSVLQAYIVSYSTYQMISSASFNQDQLPASVSVPDGDYLNISFACAFTAGGTSHSYAGSVYGIGLAQCGKNYTLSPTSYTILYNNPGAPVTTVTATTTIQPPPMLHTINVTGSHVNVSLNLSNKGPNEINLNNGVIKLVLITSRNGTANVVITNVTGTISPPANYTALSVFNISFAVPTPPNVTLDFTMHYNCGLPSSSIAPFIFANGSWSEINPFSVDASACTISFSVLGDPEVAILQALENANRTVATNLTSILTTSVLPSTTTAALQQQPQQGGSQYIVYVVVILIIVIAAAYYIIFKSKKLP